MWVLGMEYWSGFTRNYQGGLVLPKALIEPHQKGMPSSSILCNENNKKKTYYWVCVGHMRNV